MKFLDWIFNTLVGRECYDIEPGQNFNDLTSFHYCTRYASHPGEHECTSCLKTWAVEGKRRK